MVCQRCLEPANFHVGGEYDYVIIPEGKSIEDLPSGYDALEVGDDPIDLTSLVEDELLLALPLVPRHEICPDSVPLSAQSADFDASQAQRPSPFAALAALKGGKPAP